MDRSVDGGFTLLELVIVLLVIAALAGLSGPSLQSLHESVQYREAVRLFTSAVKSGRLDARAQGEAVDLIIDSENNRFLLTRDASAIDVANYRSLAEELQIVVTYAAEVSPGGNLAGIRFYPAGGSSGGEIVIQRPSGAGTRLTVDWLLGNVSQEEF
jgi:general secretion pathway protein H